MELNTCTQMSVQILYLHYAIFRCNQSTKTTTMS